MPPETLDRASEIAKETMANLEKEEKAKAEAQDQKKPDESKGAAGGDSSTENQKTEGSEEEKQKTSKSDVEIIESKDEELSEEEQARKKELIKQREEAKTPEQKLVDFQENVQKRIDALVAELKSEKEANKSDKEKIKQLEDHISRLEGDLEASGSIESQAVKTEKSMEEAWSKIAEEDKDLPREQRREMSDEELEEFLLEDYSKANQWIVKRELRRERDLAAKENSKNAVNDIEKSAKAFFTKFPGCDQEERGQQLVKEGKTEKEAIDIIRKESKEFDAMMTIFSEKPELADPNNPDAPKLLTEEMEKRLGKKSKDNPKVYTEEEVEKMKQDAIENERQRIASIDQGFGSGGTAPSSRKVDGQEVFDDPIVQKQWSEWQRASKRPRAIGQDWSKEEFLKTLKYGQTQRNNNPL